MARKYWMAAVFLVWAGGMAAPAGAAYVDRFDAGNPGKWKATVQTQVKLGRRGGAIFCDEDSGFIHPFANTLSMIQTEAHQVLVEFLHDSQAAGRRAVLVITGKGVGGEGVLRAAVPKWLNEGATRRMVRAFSHAAPKDGGQGALYVMLKRLK